MVEAAGVEASVDDGDFVQRYLFWNLWYHDH